MKQTFLLLIIGAVILCSCNAKKGWTQAQRDKLVGACRDKAISAMAGTGQNPDSKTQKRLEDYCSCYQKNLEKQFVSPKDMEKANADDVANAAKDCVELMIESGN